MSFEVLTSTMEGTPKEEELPIPDPTYPCAIYISFKGYESDAV